MGDTLVGDTGLVWGWLDRRGGHTHGSLTKFLASPANLNTSILKRSTSSRGRGVMKAELVSSDLPSTRHLGWDGDGGCQHPGASPKSAAAGGSPGLTR